MILLQKIKLFIRNLYFFIGHLMFKSSYRKGYYKTYKEALSITNQNSYYSQVGFSKMFKGNITRIEDYPILFHILAIISDKKLKFFDFGGANGSHHFIFKRHISNYEEYLDTYLVCEELETVEYCRKNIVENKLEYTDIFENCEDFDILLSVGTFQIAGDIFLEKFKSIKNKPNIILIGHIEITTEYHTFYCISNNNMIHRVSNEEELEEYFYNLGYILKDKWIEDSLVGAINWYSNINIFRKGYFFEKK